MGAIALIVIALARPQTVDVSTKTKTTRGIDIVMAIDVSASMLAKDLKPSRLEALKNVASRFIKRRPNDRIGLVEYAGESYTRTPVTSDKGIVLSAMQDIKYNNIITGGTAIGMGLAN
jgi:Ca-activated chloride channel family protein